MEPKLAARYDEWFWRASDGIRLYAQSWTPAEPPLAVVCLVHGHGEHSSRYAELAAALAAGGYATVGFDLRGHGRSEGKRGHTPAYEQLLDDISGVLGQVAECYAGLPRVLYGHSMGGGLVLNYALQRRPDIAGVIATAPWLRLTSPPPGWRLALGRLLNLIASAFAQPNGLDTNALSRDTSEVQAYRQDPLNHDLISVRLFCGCYDAGHWAIANAADFPLPLLLVHGSADRITSPQASREFAAKAPNCTLRIWEAAYHEPHNEPVRQELFAYVIEWLNAITTSKSN